MTGDTARVTVNWTGKYPTLCFGEWDITVDGIRLEQLGDKHFKTKGTYDRWEWGNHWQEIWSKYDDGLEFDQWKLDPPNGLIYALVFANIDPTEDLLRELYEAISKKDFRYLSCGGCI